MPPRLPPELSVGFEEIDGEHRHILRLIEATQASVDGGDRGEVKTTLSALGDYLMAHFAAEESIMAQAGYPERTRHKAAHDIFMQDFAQLGHEYERSGLSPLVRQWIVARVPEWIRFHIQANDVPLGEFLSARKFRPESAAGTRAKSRQS